MSSYTRQAFVLLLLLLLATSPSQAFVLSQHLPTTLRPHFGDSSLTWKRATRTQSNHLFYKNHREAQVELDLFLSQHQPSSSPRRWKTWVQRVWRSLWRLRSALQHRVRTALTTYTVYVLECANGKYYVGSTCRARQRYVQHWSGQGAAWTRLHPPVRRLWTYPRVPAAYYLGLEAQITAERMLQHGVNNVRGAMFCETRPYTVADADALTGFLGHYLNLSYPVVKGLLRQSLPASNHGTKARRRSRAHDKCFKCQQRGHWAVDCPQGTPEVVD